MKNLIFREGHKKPIYREDCLKRGGWAWTVCRFKRGRGAWQERGGVFDGC